MPRMDGIETLEKLLEIDKDLVVLMISGHGSIETAVESTKKGAYNFITKPFKDPENLVLILRNAIEYKRSKEEIRKLRQELLQANVIIGNSQAMSDVRNLIEKYANLNLNLLITGESGTGKMLIARRIHLTSNRSNKPFLVLNCAELDDDIKADTLLGKFENGRFLKRGELHKAQGGIVLFDEVANLSMQLQSRLLEIIGDSTSTDTIRELDIRFLFTTNRVLPIEIEENRFREDLYHRINVLNIHIPPIRERVEDIDALLVYYINQISKAYNIKPKIFTDAAIKKLKSFRWPGNVREFRNTIERLMFTIDKGVIDEKDIELPDTRFSRVFSDLLNRNMSLNEFQNESEKLFLQKMLNDYKYNIAQTADALKIQRSHLYKLMNKYGIPKPSEIK
jgi:two-component system nitrogen regulation response regulator NtrX